MPFSYFSGHSEIGHLVRLLLFYMTLIELTHTPVGHENKRYELARKDSLVEMSAGNLIWQVLIFIRRASYTSDFVGELANRFFMFNTIISR
jgi:hypothetical protein